MMLTGNGSQSQSVSSGDSSQSVYGDNLTTAARKVHVQGFTLDLIITFFSLSSNRKLLSFHDELQVMEICILFRSSQSH